MKSKILFNTWSGAFFNQGGGEIQLMNSKAGLEKLGYSVDLYNQWQPSKEFAVLHQFSTQFGCNYVVNGYKELGKKVAVSPILWAEFPKESFAYLQIREILNAADILFTNSDAESVKLSKGFEIENNKFHKTVNAVGREFLTLGDRRLFRETYGVEGDFVLSVANIDRRKNTLALVEACQRLKLPLVLIGAIRDLEYFNTFKDRLSGVRYLGAISNPDMLKSAALACRVFALPSLCETPGIAALEAASQGARIVITNEGAAPEYFGEYAIYVDPVEKISLETALIEGFDTRTLPTQISHIKDNFTWEKTAMAIANGYESLR